MSVVLRLIDVVVSCTAPFMLFSRLAFKRDEGESFPIAS